MGAFRSSIPELVWLSLVVACFLFLIPNTDYCGVIAEGDADLVFENNLEESKIFSHDNNRHTIERRESFHKTNNVNTKSSQPIEEDHWLNTAVKRIKRQFDWSSWFSNKDDEQGSNELREAEEVGQQTGQQSHNLNPEEENGILETLVPESQKHDSLFGSRQEHQTDDEDDFGTSGDGSGQVGRTPPPGHPLYYRITMTLLEPFLEAFNNRASPEYRDLARNLVRAVDDLYATLEGRQSATVIKVEKRQADVFSSKVTMDLSTVDFYDHGRIRNHLYSHIRHYHALGPYKVSDEEFTFRQFEGGRPLPSCLPEELPCQSGECVPASARCNGIFECEDQSDERGCDYNINEVDLTPEPPGYDGRGQDRWQHRETTPSSSISGTIFDDKTSDTGRVSQETTTQTKPWYETTPKLQWPFTDAPVFPVVTTTEKSGNTWAERFDETETTTHSLLVTIFNGLYNATKDLSEENTSSFTFPPAVGRCRADDVVRCADGIAVICAVQQCDGTRDCPGGDDEWNCPSACAEGELSCDISRCVPLIKRCDGVDDCEDGTDELECDGRYLSRDECHAETCGCAAQGQAQCRILTPFSKPPCH